MKSDSAIVPLAVDRSVTQFDSYDVSKFRSWFCDETVGTT